MAKQDQTEQETQEQAADAAQSTGSGLSLEEQLQAATSARDENYERFLRSQAELDNYRKRAQREADETRRYQALPLSRDLLPVLDNLRRAVQAASNSANAGELLQGVSMVEKQLAETLARHGLARIESVGKLFDPNLHEAIQQMPSAEHPPMTVLQEVEAGYTLNDRVVRPSRVIVSSAPPEA